MQNSGEDIVRRFEFQSTPLHEGRPPKKQSFEVVAYFKRNPRTVGKIRRFRLPSLL